MGIIRTLANYPYPILPNEKAIKVHRLYLDTSVQGSGIGRILMQYASTTAQQSSHNLVWLDAMETHQQAQGFYKNLGFQPTQSQKLPFSLLREEHRTMWYMHKMLDAIS